MSKLYKTLQRYFNHLTKNADVEDSLYTYEQRKCLHNYVHRLKELLGRLLQV